MPKIRAMSGQRRLDQNVRAGILEPRFGARTANTPNSTCSFLAGQHPKRFLEGLRLSRKMLGEKSVIDREDEVAAMAEEDNPHLFTLISVFTGLVHLLRSPRTIRVALHRRDNGPIDSE